MLTKIEAICSASDVVIRSSMSETDAAATLLPGRTQPIDTTKIYIRSFDPPAINHESGALKQTLERAHYIYCTENQETNIAS